MGWLNELSVCVLFWEVVGFKPHGHGFEPWSSQNNDLKIYTCRYLAWCSALLGLGKEQQNEEDQFSTIEIFPA